MAESSWPSPSNGRIVDDIGYEKVGIALGPTAGVLGDFTSPQLVYGDSTGLQCKVAADRYALVGGHVWWSGSSIMTKTIGANTSGSTRIDLVVLRLSRSTWDVTLTVIAGTPGSGAPAPVQNTGVTGSFDLPLATVTVANNASTISAGNVVYVGPHLNSSGNRLRLPASTAVGYVPLPTPGMTAALPDGTTYRYTSASAWSASFGTFRPLVRLVAQTTQTIADNTDTLLTFGGSSEEIDTHGFHSTSSNTGRITPTYPGYYRLTGKYITLGRTDFVTIGCGILKNGTASDWDRRGPTAQTAVRVATISSIQQANGTSDYFELWCAQNNTANASVGTSVSPAGFACTFECEYLGPLAS